MERRSPLHTFGRSIRKIISRPAVELDPCQAYDLWAATYDDSAGNALLHVERSVVDTLIDRVDVRGKSVLDAGCGTGRHFGRLLKGSPAFLCGVDISPNMLREAIAKIPGDTPALLQVAGVENLPFRDEMFDLAISALVLDHVPDLQSALGELGRVLRSGGTLIISSFHPFGKLLSWRMTFRAAGSEGGKVWYAARYYLHLHADYINGLRSAGMEIAELREPVIDESVRPFYERAGRMDIFQRFKGYPMLLVMRARKT